MAVHEAIEKADGVVFRCTLSGSAADRWLEVPAWMFDRAACPDAPRLATAPFVSVDALSALTDLLQQALKASSASSNAPLSGACRSSHDQNRGEAHDDVEIGATASNSGRAPQSSEKGSPQQIDLFAGASPREVPAWRELPEETRGALTGLMVRLILEQANGAVWRTEAGDDL